MIFGFAEDALAASGKTGVLLHHRLLCGFRNSGGCECSFAFSCTRAKFAVAILQHAVTGMQQIWLGYCSIDLDDLTLQRKHTAHLSQYAAMICIDRSPAATYRNNHDPLSMLFQGTAARTTRAVRHARMHRAYDVFTTIERCSAQTSAPPFILHRQACRGPPPAADGRLGGSAIGVVHGIGGGPDMDRRHQQRLDGRLELEQRSGTDRRLCYHRRFFISKSDGAGRQWSGKRRNS
ncbi:hypothetical protein [Bradyrhizobium yuanmingense]|uniref:hypothetical protein n=1 Tax=Bradyrhizobium yuanmingense TaxID=108015 RepID=UPI003518E3EA